MIDCLIDWLIVQLLGDWSFKNVCVVLTNWSVGSPKKGLKKKKEENFSSDSFWLLDQMTSLIMIWFA